MKKIIFLITISLIVLSCETNNIEGKYKKIEGSGNGFEMAFIDIKETKEDNYLVTITSEEKDELEYKAIKKENKLTWDDKGLPMEIEFLGNSATFKAGGGTYGEYKIKKIKESETKNELKKDAIENVENASLKEKTITKNKEEEINNSQIEKRKKELALLDSFFKMKDEVIADKDGIIQDYSIKTIEGDLIELGETEVVVDKHKKEKWDSYQLKMFVQGVVHQLNINGELQYEVKSFYQRYILKHQYNWGSRTSEGSGFNHIYEPEVDPIEGRKNIFSKIDSYSPNNEESKTKWKREYTKLIKESGVLELNTYDDFINASWKLNEESRKAAIKKAVDAINANARANAELEAQNKKNEIGEGTNEVSDTIIESKQKYPEASKRLLTLNDLVDMSSEELKIMRNEIFARYGHSFSKGGAMEIYFKSQSWYTSKNLDATNLLTEMEKKNIKLIRTME